jgi:hypothetical protein
MTQLLEKAIIEIHKLGPERQDAMAALILDEIADEQKWDNAFARSQDQLAQLARKARADRLAGRLRKTGFGDL